MIKDAIGALLNQGPAVKVSPPSIQPAPALPRPKDPLGMLIRNSGADRTRADNERADAKQKDSIVALIKSNVPADGAEPSTETVAAAQRALVRLGFVLRADGVWGASSKKAIELFEHDHGLPADGNLSPRVTKQLSQLSGISIP
jgi:peptidoglycan hydrolase-like protein with peptidoglycan-binding domain